MIVSHSLFFTQLLIHRRNPHGPVDQQSIHYVEEGKMEG